MDDARTRAARTDRTGALAGRLSRRHLLRYGLLGLPSLAALAACGDDSTGPAGRTTVAGRPGTTTAGTGSAPSSTTATGGAPSNVDRTAILRFGAMRGSSLDPMRVGTQSEYPLLNAIYDTLLTTDPITTELGPRLATDWDISEERVRLTLRDDVVFQDDTPFDAEAVKFSVERAMSDSESNITERLAMLDRVEVVDATTVDFHLAEPQPLPLLLQLADRAGMIVSPTAVEAAGGSEAFSAAPVGAGMYRVEGEWFPRESMSVRAWDGYWDPDAALLGGIDFTEVAMAARLNALRAGEVDMGAYQGADAQAIDNDPDLGLVVGLAPLIKGLIINIEEPPFDDVNVRKAIAHAIDREAAVEALTLGYGRPAHQMFAEGSAAYDPDLEGLYEHDVDKAGELLDDAGHSDGVSFHSIIGSTAAPYVQFGQFLQANLKDADIEMDLELVDASTVIGRIFDEFSAASAPIATSGGVADTTIRLSLLDDGALNPGDIEVPGVRELVEQAATASSQEEANEYYREISRIQAEGLYAIIPVYNEPALTGHAPYVGGITRGMADTDVSPEMFRGIYITEGQVSVES